MSKRTIGLIIALIVVTSFLLAIALSPQKTTVSKPAPVLPTPTPVAKTIIFLSPNPLVTSSTSATVDVNIDTKGNNITAVQLELSYDPRLLTVVDASPSGFFNNPLVLLENIDTQNGKISYALAIPPAGAPKRGSGIVATISFKTKMDVGQKTEINVLPKTMVTATGVTSSVLKQARGTTIIFGQQTATNSAL